MKLAEYKGKKLLRTVGVKTPISILVNNRDYASLSYGKERYHQFFNEHGAAVVKAQVIGGGRKKKGLIIEVTDYETSLKQIDELYKTQHEGGSINTLLIEEKLDVKKEFFLSILYDTYQRQPMILFSEQGGIDIEDNSQTLNKIYPDKVNNVTEEEVYAVVKNKALAALIVKVYQCFIEYDCTHLEINPIILTKDGQLYAADAKITIDDSAVPRQEDFSEMSEKTNFSELEIKARKIDQADHRGVAGKTFVELDGDIAVLASGGGASLTCMDALIEAGGSPANYTEYSGNPPREKVRQLTEITLSKEGLNGCLVIGGTANFTDIFETLSGFVEGMQALPELPKYPIVIRRAGPNDKQAFEMLEKFTKENDMDITLFGEETPMSYAAKVMAEKVEEYKKS